MALTDHIRKDSPTNNFATLNPLAPDTGDDFAMSEGNLRLYTVSSFSSDGRNISTIPFLPAMGKIYIEVAKTTNAFAFGFSQGSNAFGIYGNTTGNFEVFAGTNNNGQLTWQYRSNSGHFPALNTSATEVIGILIDFTNSQFKIKLSSTDYTYSFSHSSYINFSNTDNILLACTNGGNAGYGNFNFGADPTFAGYITLSGSYGTYTDANGIGSFFYDPTAIDSGALALCTQNIPTPSVDSVAGNGPEDFFKCLTYSGTGNQQDIAVGFKPDLVWAKSRTQTYSHMLYDTVRGQKHLNSDNTDTEVSDTQLAFHATDGFTVATSSGELNDATGAPNNFAAWCWRAGGAPSGATSATGSAKRINSSGTQDDTSCNALRNAAASVGSNHIITPTLMSINQQTGFSIVKYIGGNASNGHTNANSALGMQGIPHGLGKYAKFVLIKSLDTASGWVAFVPHPTYGLGHNYHLRLDTTAAGSGNNWTGDNRQGISYIPDTDNVIYVGNDNMVSKQDDNFIMYVFTDIEGYSAFGSYTGNGDNDNDDDPDPPFIYTGFSPAFVWIKSISNNTGWYLFDNARSTHNENDNPLRADASTAESSVSASGYKEIDLLSNGFKIRNDRDQINSSSHTYLYCAWAEQNFKYTTAR
tara:strand:+ start:2666 stop:4588 length:1923 start_codon:yes stop_codon:yes gene_type:complete